MKASPLPDQSRFAFIVGAPRSGTTTLAGFLQQHPDVCFSAVKEPHYFSGQDFLDMSDAEIRDHVGEEYLARFFGDCDGSEKLRAEGSVTYLYTPERMATILQLWPKAQFVIALRDPLSMLPSLHSRLLVTGDEAIRNFAQAWDMVAERAEGRSIPRSAIDPRFLRYDEAGALGSRVEQLFDVVGQERCHVVLFDDLIADPAATYRRLCAFLDIEPRADVNLGARRENKAIRFSWLQRMLKRPPKAVRTVLAGEKFRQREKKLDASEGRAIEAIFKVRKRLLDWNRIPAKRQPLNPRVRQEIIDRLRDEVVLLSQVIGRDLSHWLGGVPEANPSTAEKLRA